MRSHAPLLLFFLALAACDSQHDPSGTPDSVALLDTSSDLEGSDLHDTVHLDAAPELVVDLLFDGTPPEDSPEDSLLDVAPDHATVPPTRVDIPALSAALEAGDGVAIDEWMTLYDGPACDDETCIVVTWVPDRDQVAIRGEFNGWAEESMEASPLAGWFSIEIPAGVVDSCKEYKLYSEGDWFRDPSNRWMTFADVAINSALCPKGVSRIALVEDVYSSQLDNARFLYVYVPAAAFEDPTATFPVLYMQDGFNIFVNPMAPYGSWEVNATADALIAAGAVAPLIIVGIDTNNRMDEYLYTGITVDLGSGPVQITPLLPDYADFLVDTVKPLIDGAFPTRPGREDTAMAGSSLGGISSLWIAWHHADVFGRIASFSGSYWVAQEGSGTEGPDHDTMEEVLQYAPPTADQAALKIYMDSGTVSFMGQEDLAYTGDGRCYTDWTRNVLISLGWDNRPEWDDDGALETPPGDFPTSSDPAAVPTLDWSPTVPEGYGGWDDYLKPEQNLLHLVGEGHEHNEAAWAARSGAMFRFLFPGS